jgi:hypothetical protein
MAGESRSPCSGRSSRLVDTGRYVMGQTTVRLVNNIVMFDAERGHVRVAPRRLYWLGFAGLAAVLPLVLLLANRTGRWSLTSAGWFLTCLLLGAGLVIVVAALSPRQRTVAFDFLASRVRVAGIYGLTPARYYSFDEVRVVLDTRTFGFGALTASSPYAMLETPRSVVYLIGATMDSMDVPSGFARGLERARRGDVPNGLQAARDALRGGSATEPMPRERMLLILAGSALVAWYYLIR